jgi:hypothetical protein
MDTSAQLEPLFRKPYILGGKAIVTVVNPDSGNRFTYRIKSKDVGTAEAPRTIYFVGVLTGPDNTEDYSYLGTIFEGDRFVHGKKSRITPDAPSAKAFAWVWDHIDSDRFEIWHSGSCSKCNRLLSVDASIKRGMGPKCAGLRS